MHSNDIIEIAPIDSLFLVISLKKITNTYNFDYKRQ